MLYTIKILKSIDQFGVSFQPSIQYSKSEYKTWQGGFVSLLLYGLSFSYLIYILIQWQTGQILPTNTTLSQYQPNFALELNDTYIELELSKYRYTHIDPFNSSAIIFQPVVYYFVNGEAPQKGYPQLYEINTNSTQFQKITIKNLNLSISQDQTIENPQIQIMLILSQCAEELLQTGQKCADNNTITSFFNQFTNTLKAKMHIQQFNMNTRVLDTIVKESLILLDKGKTYFAQTTVQIAQVQVDTGLLLQDQTDYTFISDTSIAGTLVDEPYFTSIFGVPVSAAFYYNIDSIQVVQNISYVKVGDILANAGSIASTLLLLSYLVIIMNQKYLEFEAVNQIIQMYYPDFKNVKIFKNVFGKIIRVEKNGKNIDLDVFVKYYEKLRKIGEVKLTISNQIYEISRIQFLLQTLFTDKQIKVMHHIGIPLAIDHEDQPVNSNPEGGISKLEQSMNNDYQYKTNQILPNCQSNDELPENRLKEVELPRQNSTQQQITVNVTQENLLKHIQIEPPPIQLKNNLPELCLKDKDFELLILQEENLQQEELALQNAQLISKNVSDENLLNQQNV